MHFIYAQSFQLITCNFVSRQRGLTISHLTSSLSNRASFQVLTLIVKTIFRLVGVPLGRVPRTATKRQSVGDEAGDFRVHWVIPLKVSWELSTKYLS